MLRWRPRQRAESTILGQRQEGGAQYRAVDLAVPSKANTIAASTAAAAFVTDRDARILAWNAAAERLLGYRKGRAIGQRCYELLCGTDVFGNRHCGKSCPIFDMVLGHESVHPFVLDLQTATGNRIRVAASVFVVPEKKPQNGAIVHVLTPITTEFEFEKLGDRRSVAAQPPASVSSVPDCAPASLTPREIEVLRHVAQGRSTGEIAHLLFISSVTVRNHVQHILRKLGAHNRLGAVSLVRRAGLL